LGTTCVFQRWGDFGCCFRYSASWARPPFGGGGTSVEARDDIIRMVAANNWNAYTCRRVEGLGKATVSPAECAARVEPANAECIEIAKAKLPQVSTEDEAGFLVEILMTCPVAKVLDIGYIIDGRKIHIQWNEIGR